MKQMQKLDFAQVLYWEGTSQIMLMMRLNNIWFVNVFKETIDHSPQINQHLQEKNGSKIMFDKTLAPH